MKYNINVHIPKLYDFTVRYQTNTATLQYMSLDTCDQHNFTLFATKENFI